MKIYIGSDHRGFNLKEELKAWLVSLGHDIVDCGNKVYDPSDDFPDFAFDVADRVARDLESRGIVICGSSGGVTIAANKVRNIRCTSGISRESVIHDRDHNDINILAVASDWTSADQVKELIDLFLKTPYKKEARFARRLEKISERER